MRLPRIIYNEGEAKTQMSNLRYEGGRINIRKFKVGDENEYKSRN